MVQLKIIKLAILDDAQIDREIAKLACAMIGIICTTFSNERDFMANYQNYDGAILDYSMPNKNGVEVAELIREKSPTYPILFRSNYPEGSKAHLSMLKFGDVISKDLKEGVLYLLKKFAINAHEKRQAEEVS